MYLSRLDWQMRTVHGNRFGYSDMIMVMSSDLVVDGACGNCYG